MRTQRYSPHISLFLEIGHTTRLWFLKLFERRSGENCKHPEASAISHLQRVLITFELLIQAFEVIPSLCHLSNCTVLRQQHS